MKILLTVLVFVAAMVVAGKYSVISSSAVPQSTPLPFATETPQAWPSATPIAFPDMSSVPRKMPPEKVPCDTWVAAWGKSYWPGTRTRPKHLNAKGQKGKWTCRVEHLAD